MALSLADARQAAARGVDGAGSSSSHSSAAMYNDFMPASVAALIDMGFSEERALEAYVNTDHGSAYDMMRYISQQIIQSKRARSPARPHAPTSLGRQPHVGPVTYEAGSSAIGGPIPRTGVPSSTSRGAADVADGGTGLGSSVPGIDLEARALPNSGRTLARGGIGSRPSGILESEDVLESQSTPKYPF
jgi:hypothetical protein